MSEARDSIFLVVVTEEKQYSLWPQHKPLPLGWFAEGFNGNEADCLAHIERVWVDMTPKSLRGAVVR